MAARILLCDGLEIVFAIDRRTLWVLSLNGLRGLDALLDRSEDA